MRAREFAISLLAPALLATGTALAHSRSVSYSTWTLDGGGLRAELRLPTSVLNAAGLDPDAADTAPRLAARLQSDFVPLAGALPCIAGTASARRSGLLFVVQGRWQCPAAVTELRARFLLDRVPGHLHLLQVEGPDGLQGPFALSASQPSVQLSLTDDAPPPAEFGPYVGLGAAHILGGWDHLAFLLVLLLGATTAAQLAWRVTGFTLGHSLSLGLAALGAVRPPELLVETFIALTIAATAAERLLADQPRAVLHGGVLSTGLAALAWFAGVLPLALVLAACLLSLGANTDARLDSLRTGLFGLFHGFGFAGVLGELNPAQAPPVLPLFGFNLGVEIGQLLFVLPLWWAARRYSALRSPAVPAAVLALGSFWFVYRIA